MGFRIEVFEGDTLTRELALTDGAGAAYNLTGKTVVLRIAAALLNTKLIEKSTTHDGAGGIVSVVFEASDYTLIPATTPGGTTGTPYAATLLIDGDVVENGDVLVKPVVRNA